MTFGYRWGHDFSIVPGNENSGHPNPSPETRFGAARGNTPNAGGRTPTAWLREKLAKSLKDGDVSAREAIADHLIEIATSYEVIVKGREDPVPLASAKDSIEAAKVLYAYDMGKPIESHEVTTNSGPKVLFYLPVKDSALASAASVGKLDASSSG